MGAVSARIMGHLLHRLFPHLVHAVDWGHPLDPQLCHVARLQVLGLVVNAAGETSVLLVSTTCSSNPVGCRTVALVLRFEDGVPIGNRAP